MTIWQLGAFRAGVGMRVEWLESALKHLEGEANYIGLENPQAATVPVRSVECAKQCSRTAKMHP